MVRRREGRKVKDMLWECKGTGGEPEENRHAVGNWMVVRATICRVCVPSFVDAFRGLFRSTPKCNESFRGCLQFLGHGKCVK